jgi:hypothetical protein
MKTNLLRKFTHLAISALLVAAIFAAALPQPARAATCARYYTVKEGDTTPKIAHTFDLKWGVIAKANKLNYPYKLKAGQVLCIPGEASTESTGESISYKVVARGSTVTVTVTNPPNKRAYYVRVRDVSAGAGDWFKIGKFKVKKNETNTAVFSIPKELRTKLYLQVCLKNATTDELTCRTALHY